MLVIAHFAMGIKLFLKLRTQINGYAQIACNHMIQWNLANGVAN